MVKNLNFVIVIDIVIDIEFEKKSSHNRFRNRCTKWSRT